MDIDKLTFHEAQQEAKRAGINTKGMSRDTMIAAMKAKAFKELSANGEVEVQRESPELTENSPGIGIVGDGDISPNTPIIPGKIEFIPEPIPTPSMNPKFDINAGKQAPAVMRRRIEIDKLVDAVNEKFKRLPGCTARYCEIDECIQFRGGPKQAEDVTVHQPEKTVLKLADFYIMRMHTGQGVVGV